MSFEVNPPPTDSVSRLQFSPQQDLLAVGSWDNQTRIYEIQQNGSSTGKAIIQHEAPVLDVCWSTYWDLRSPTPAHTLQLPERCYSIDVKNSLMVVATAERNVLIYNLNNPASPHKTITSPLKWQTRVVSCFPDATGYALGSIEGRCAIEYVEDRDSSRKFTFKCHREQKNVFPVNDISFHPQYGTLATVGGNGGVNFWDKDARISLKAHPTAPGPVTSASFNRNGTIFAYGVSYDWHKGHAHNQNSKISITLLAVKDEDIKNRPRK
ncbi:WD40-repeat-containing domain protein [Globomyces pollinis-pini]|nr:WD40-repeat-containing domain protein [Globomyces pollinis-pini]